MCFFKFRSIFGNNLFFDPILQQEGKNICTYAIPHISQEPQECGKLSGVQIFLVQVTVEKWPQDHYFSQKVLFNPFLTQYYNRKGTKYISAIPLYHTYHKNLTGVSSYLGADLFPYTKTQQRSEERRVS